MNFEIILYVQHLPENSKIASTKPRDILWKRSKIVNRKPEPDIVIRPLINRDFKNNKAIKSKEMMNSSNYTLITYLSDIESKFIPCYFCVVLANLSF